MDDSHIAGTGGENPVDNSEMAAGVESGEMADKTRLIASVSRHDLTKLGYRWDVECDGHALTARYWPLRDMAQHLLDAGYPSDTLVSMQDGRGFDCIKPLGIEAAARGGGGEQPEHLRRAK